MDFFSNSEVPSLCLRDVKRTEAFRNAIQRIVRPGDVVLDAGSGSGILSFFAARAGAAKVFAVEGDESLCDLLRANAALNGFGSIIEVIHADVRELTALGQADVVIAELIDTWLCDELQVPALQALRQNGVIGSGTKIVPGSYEAIVTFGHVDYDCYGFRIPFPIHDWPDLDEDSGWQPMPFQPLTEPAQVFVADFASEIEPDFTADLRTMPIASGTVNAVRLSGVVHLGGGVSLCETVAFNGNKLLPIPPIRMLEGQPVIFRISGNRGGTSKLAELSCVFQQQGN